MMKSLIFLPIPLALVLASCGGGGNGGPTDTATDADAPADVVEDSGPDAEPDPVEDPTPDAEPDAAGDPIEDTEDEYTPSAAAEYFCDGYASLCGYGTTGRFADRDECLRSYDSWTTTQQVCAGNALGDSNCDTATDPPTSC